MAYSLTPGVPLGDAVVAVVNAEVEAALVSLARVHAAADPDAVHDVRKRTKKLRAVALALRSSVSRAQWRAVYRSAGQAARTLADSRDAQVRLGTLTALVADRQAEFADALAHASVLARPAPARRDGHGGATAPAGEESVAEDVAEERVQHASWLLTGVLAEVGSWEVADRFASIEGGLGDTYRDGRRGWRSLAADPAGVHVADADVLHRWRRSVKHRWYHTRLLAAVAPDLLGAESTLLDELGEALGVDHDLAVLVEAMADDPGRWGGAPAVAEVAHLARHRQVELRTRALELGRQLYALPTGAHLARLGIWWDQARRAAR